MRFDRTETVMMTFYLTGIVLHLFVFASAVANRIIFTATPTSVIPLLTQQLEMRCGVGNTPNVPEIKHVVSIGITRGVDETIAGITDFTPPKAYADVDQLKVYGNVNGTSGDQSFLLAVWSKPVLKQIAKYKCYISFLNSHGQPGKLTSILKVKGPTLGELVNTVIKQQEEINVQKDAISQQQEEINVQKEANSQLQEEIIEQKEAIFLQQEEINVQKEANSKQQEEINVQKEVNSKQQEEINVQKEAISKQQEGISNLTNVSTQLSAQVNTVDEESKHIETNFMWFDGNTGWQYGSWGRKWVTQKFARPYTRIPLAIATVAIFKTRTDKSYVRFEVWLHEVNTTHITLVAWKQNDDGDSKYLRARWITFVQ